MKIFLLLLFFQAASGKDECDFGACCHPSYCVQAEDAPSCDGMMCTTQFIDGTVNRCEMEDGICVGYTVDNERKFPPTPSPTASTVASPTTSPPSTSPPTTSSSLTPTAPPVHVDPEPCAYNTCCHPSACISIEEGPETGCEGMFCTEIWYYGTLTKCVEEDGICVGYTPDGGESGELNRVNRCKPNACCHPTHCVKDDYTPFCGDTVCTAEYVEGTVARCEMEDDICVGYTLENDKKLSPTSSCPVMIDVRTYSEYEAGHVSCAASATSTDTTKILEHLNCVAPDKNAEIRLYCKSGNRAGTIKEFIESHGFLNVINDGGYLAEKDRLETVCNGCGVVERCADLGDTIVWEGGGNRLVGVSRVGMAILGAAIIMHQYHLLL